MKATISLTIVATGSTLASAQSSFQVDPVKNDGSLYGTRSHSLFASRTAMNKGDIVTIIISEQSAAQLSASTTATKKDTNVVDPTRSSVLNWLNLPVVSAFTGANSSGANSSVAGAGTTTGSSNFTATMSAIVREVLPNGNMVVEGTRDLKLNKETHTIVISGIIRRDDVRPDNTVLSANLAMAEIRSFASGGVIADRQRRGILTRILDFLF